ncbi:MAG: phosphopantetheine-binding protein [Azospirillaceae bacterium]
MEISDEIEQRLVAAVGRAAFVETDAVSLDTTIEDLGLDSADMVQVVFEIEDEFDISLADQGVEGVATVRDLVALLARARAPSAAE